jgi:hypothetical protein
VTRPIGSARILLYTIDYCCGDLLDDVCWLAIDDYFGPAKAAPLRTQFDALVGEGRLVPFGYYGWGAWVGQ